MIVQAGPYTYEWIEDWAQLPPSGGWAHHGFAVRRDGGLVSGHPAEPRIMIFDADGRVQHSFLLPVTETHGITVSEEDGAETLWVVDNGSKYQVTPQYPVQLLKCTMQGEVLAQLTRSDFHLPEQDPFGLTACAVDPDTGSLWVADGYGSSRIFRFSPDLKLEQTLDGSEGAAGRFAQPHSVWTDRRKGHTEIYISDRKNNRIQIYAPDGTFLRCLDQGFSAPSAFASFDDVLVVAELNARIWLLDGDDRPIAALGDGRAHLDRPGWPNRLDDDRPVSPRDVLPPGAFNSPHGICADGAGNIYISEWLIGDRWIKLARR